MGPRSVKLSVLHRAFKGETVCSARTVIGHGCSAAHEQKSFTPVDRGDKKKKKNRRVGVHLLAIKSREKEFQDFRVSSQPPETGGINAIIALFSIRTVSNISALTYV